MVRYADDFVVLADSRRRARQALALTEDALAGLELRLDPEKTRITRYDDGFKFLGVVFLRDMLLQPLEEKPKPRRLLHSARPMPAGFFPESEKRRLRRYRAW
ncbi:MAG: hypothetical protein H6509_15750 [Bryobacterales bacterium]|nr:hypothetical protein [Bryobacterales bacterium]